MATGTSSCYDISDSCPQLPSAKSCLLQKFHFETIFHKLGRSQCWHPNDTLGSDTSRTAPTPCQEGSGGEPAASAGCGLLPHLKTTQNWGEFIQNVSLLFSKVIFFSFSFYSLQFQPKTEISFPRMCSLSAGNCVSSLIISCLIKKIFNIWDRVSRNKGYDAT